jgi:hypothetical protein
MGVILSTVLKSASDVIQHWADDADPHRNFLSDDDAKAITDAFHMLEQQNAELAEENEELRKQLKKLQR